MFMPMTKFNQPKIWPRINNISKRIDEAGMKDPTSVTRMQRNNIFESSDTYSVHPGSAPSTIAEAQDG